MCCDPTASRYPGYIYNQIIGSFQVLLPPGAGEEAQQCDVPGVHI